MKRNRNKPFKVGSYPGDEYRQAICDMCGVKRFVKDMTYIDDQYNRINGALVCIEHADPVHPQDIPYWILEEQVDDPRYVRPRTADRFVVNESSNILPSAPRLLIATLSPLDDVIQLTWQGPDNTGSGSIIGYRIQISNPQGLPFATLEDNTGNGATMYLDTVSPITGFYYYRVAAISEIGVGAYSDQASFPYDSIITNILIIVGDDLIGIAGDDNILLLGDQLL